MLYVDDNEMSDWKTICKAFARKVGATLLFVNDSSLGLEYPDGTMQHIYIDELMDILERR